MQSRAPQKRSPDFDVQEFAEPPASIIGNVEKRIASVMAFEGQLDARGAYRCDPHTNWDTGARTYKVSSIEEPSPDGLWYPRTWFFDSSRKFNESRWLAIQISCGTNFRDPPPPLTFRPPDVYREDDHVPDDDVISIVGRLLVRSKYWKRSDCVLLGGGKADFDDGVDGAQFWFVDGEDLAEGDVEELLMSMAPSLARLGVDLTVETTSLPAAGPYTLRVNGQEVVLFESDNDPDPWRQCTERPLARVNQLLATAGSNYRIGVFEPGTNTGMALLLPADLLAKAAKKRSLKNSEFVLP
jgi:hypothetical protein